MSRKQGSGSAIFAAVVVALGLLLLHCEVAEAATYTVGKQGMWTFNMGGWPNRPLRANDVLVFNYDPKVHNVVAVSRAGYSTCTVPRGSRTWQTGKDRISLSKGTNYFICSVPGHCASGMKIAVTAV